MFANLRNQNGNIAIAMLSAIIVLGVFLETTGFRGINEAKNTLLRTRAKDGRNSVAFQVERYATLPVTFRNSLASPENSDLRNCILGTSAVLCNGDGTEYPVSLYSPSTEMGATSPLLVAGTSSSAGKPALYDGNGRLCKTGAVQATPACPFEVYTSFKAKCPIATGSPCAKAETIQVRFQIKIPTSIASIVETKGRFIMSDVDKLAAEIKTADILPPPFGYVPNRITKVNLIGETTTVTTTITSDGITSYDEALAVIKAAMGADTSQAAAAADTLYNTYKLADPALVSALAAQWVKNADVAKGISHFTWWRVNTGLEMSPDTINKMGAEIGSVTAEQPYMLRSLAAAGLSDRTVAQNVANSMVGITNETAIEAIAFAGITNKNVAQALATALISMGMTDVDLTIPLGVWVNDTQTTDAAKIIEYANSSQLIPSPHATTTAKTKTYTTTTTTVTEAAPKASPAQGSLIKACSSIKNCGTQVGL